MDFIFEILKESVFFVNEVSIYLIFGFIVAGILHVLFPESIIRRHMGKNSVSSVIKSTLFGIPLPLCSCGVVPVAASLKKNGASKGASISFLISTPQVGADSFMLTYSLLGWIFGTFRIIASLVTAITAGVAVNFLSRNDDTQTENIRINKGYHDTMTMRLKTLLSYIEYELLGSIANALVVGLIIAGVIAAAFPEDFFSNYLNYPIVSMILMLAVGIPMYVCAAASTPIAASLVMKGISPGAALVFLLTGPATNAITISTVIKTLGKSAATVYLLSISIISLLLGYLLNIITVKYGFNKIIMIHQHEMFPGWLKIAGSAALCMMLGWYYLNTGILKKYRKEGKMSDNRTSINVGGMTCMHCASNVKKAVEAVSGTSDILVNLEKGNVNFLLEDNINIEEVKAAIASAGYEV